MIAHLLPPANDPDVLYILDLHAFVWRFASGSGRWAFENFTRWFGDLLRDRRPHRIVAADDFGGHTFRHDRLEIEGFPAYKGDRKRLNDEEAAILRNLRDDVADLLTGFEIPIVRAQGFEADDVIASIAYWLSDCCVVIVAGDRDLYQLIRPDNRVILWDGWDKVTTREACIAEMGIPPKRIPDYFALVGGKNNLPGVPKIGPKAAVEILAHVSLNEALDLIASGARSIDAGKIGTDPKLREKLRAGEKAAVIGLELARLRTDVPLDFTHLETAMCFDPTAFDGG